MGALLCRIGLHHWGEVTWIAAFYPVVWCQRCNKKRIGAVSG